MSNTTQTLEKDVAQMEERLANVKVTVAGEKEAWRRSFRTGKRGTKWQSAKLPSENTTKSEDVTLMPDYWDVLELAQFLKAKELESFAQIIMSEQITGKKLLDTPVLKLQKLFKTVANDSNWKLFQKEYMKLKKHQQQLEKAVNSDHSQPNSCRSLVSNDRQTSVINSATSGLIFPLISPRLPVTNSATTQVQKPAKHPSKKSSFSLRKPAASNNIPIATCWKCKTRFFRPHCRKSVAKTSGSNVSVSSSLRASFVARAYCSEACEENIKATDLCISTCVKVTINNSVQEKIKHTQSSRGLTLKSSVELDLVEDGVPNLQTKTFAQPFRPENPNGFNFLRVAASKRKTSAIEVAESNLSNAISYGKQNRSGNGAENFTLYPLVTSLGIINNLPTTLKIDTSALKQCKVYQQSKYKLDPDLFQARLETFSSCFGANVTGNLRAVDAGRGNLLRLQEYFTVRSLYRLSLTSHMWYDLITKSSPFSDALWSVHVLRTWRRSEEFLQIINVLKKPERPRRMLQLLTRHISRLVVENMKVLLNPDTWQLATVMTLKESHSMRSMYKLIRRRELDEIEIKEGLPTAELYEQITVIYTQAGEIVAVCARQLIRPLDPMALLTDILHGLKNGTLDRVHCRRLRLFSQSNRLPFEQWVKLPYCSRSVVEFFWSTSDKEEDVNVPLEFPMWHQKILSKLQHALQQRLLGKDSIKLVLKVAHDQNASAANLRSLEKFLLRCHTHASN